MKDFLCLAFGLSMYVLAPSCALAQTKPAFTYDEQKEVAAAEMGVERVAPGFVPTCLLSAPDNNTTLWVQVDLGSRQRIDGIKVLPGCAAWGKYYGGFPVRFYISVSDDPSFSSSVVYADYTSMGEFPNLSNPEFKVLTLDSRTCEGRYVRFTATQLRDNRLVLRRLRVLQNGKDIARGCAVTSSTPNSENLQDLTAQDRPGGELVVTDNPANVIPVSQWKAPKQLIETPLTGITLHDGVLKTVMENNIYYLLHSFTFDELVRNFRLKAGIPVQPFNPNFDRFWMKELPGSEAGRFLMSAGNTLRWMDNAELRKEMNDIVDVIDQCKEPDGYCMAYPKGAIFTGERGAYTRSWVSQGLIEAGFGGNQKAFTLLRGFYDWFDHCPFLPEIRQRAMQGVQGMIPITRTYFTPVGKPEDIQTAQRYYQDNWWMDSLSAHKPSAIWRYPYDRAHNYLVTTFEAYMDLYLATGAGKYLDAMVGAWDLMHDNWEFPGGSLAINEGDLIYNPHSLWLSRECGELCGNAFWVRFNQRFHHLFPQQMKYVDEMEKSIYNVIIANQVGKNGIRYFAKLNGHKYGPHGAVKNFMMNTCCEGQGARMYGTLPEYLYSTASDGVYVDMYAGSDFKCKLGGGFSFSTDTRFPYDGKVSITITGNNPVKTKLYLRIPTWTQSAVAIRVNGKSAGKGKAGTYCVLSRTWKPGDRIEFVLPMPMKTTLYTGMEPGFEKAHYCLEYGPIMMAAVRTSGEGNIEIPASPRDIASRLVPVAGKPLHFTVKGAEGVEYWPFYEVQEENFTCFPKFLK